MPFPFPEYPQQLETALLIRLRDTLRWESALAPVNASGTFSGTLTAPDTERQTFTALDYERRDRELAWLDTRNAAAVVDVSLEVADVWNATALRPRMEGPQVGHIDYQPQDVANMLSRVIHVKYASVPIEALRVDRELSGRDVVIYETLFNAVQNLFAAPPISTSGAPSPTVTAWSYAQGTAAQQDINSNLPLDRALFRTPDMNLSDRDNQMAAYVSQLCQVLKNPFAYADRLYVAVYGVDSREVETYTLIEQLFEAGTVYFEGDEIYHNDVIYRVKPGVGTTSDVPWDSPWAWDIVTTPNKRVWTAEPALSGRNRFVYDVLSQTIQWFRESADVQHIPQLVALAVPGIFSGQTLQVIAQVPERKDGQFWRNKAAHVVPAGGTLSDFRSLDTVAREVQHNFTIQTTGASLPVPVMASVYFPDPVTSSKALPAGQYRVSALVEPNSIVEIPGGENNQGVGGIASGVTFSGYTSVSYNVGFPPTAWTVEFDYTNLSGSTDGFRVRASIGSSLIFDDTAPFYFNDDNGDPLPNGTIVTSPAFPFTGNGSPQVFTLAWTGGTGQLHVRAVRFRSTALNTGRFRISGTLAGQHAFADVIGQNAVPGVLNWDFTVAAPSTTDMTLWYEKAAELPIRFFRMDMAKIGQATATPNSQGFENYRQDCLVRAARSAKQAFTDAYFAGTEAGTFLSAGTIWDVASTERWIATIEQAEPRLRQIENVDANAISPGRTYVVTSGSLIYEGQGYGTGKGSIFIGNQDSVYVWAVTGNVNQVGAWQKSKSTHNGRPALVPAGVYFDYTYGTATAANPPDLTVPELATLQPWMIELGFYVSQPEFWLPKNV